MHLTNKEIINMKILNKRVLYKSGQSLVEFVLVAILIGIVAAFAFVKMNPNMFKTYFKGSISGSNIDSNGQMTMQTMGD